MPFSASATRTLRTNGDRLTPCSISNHYGNIFLAKGVTLDQPKHEATEFMTIHKFPAKKVIEMARSGEINDCISIMAILLAEPYILD
jgi:hypothetical protein